MMSMMMIIVSMVQQVFVYRFKDLKLMDQITTGDCDDDVDVDSYDDIVNVIENDHYDYWF